MPKVFLVNWFRKGEDGEFLWPGFGENSRVLEWVFRRCAGEGEARETAVGLVPPASEINTEGLNIEQGALEQLLTVEPDLIEEQLPQVEEFLARFGDRLPAQIGAQLEALKARLG